MKKKDMETLPLQTLSGERSSGDEASFFLSHRRFTSCLYIFDCFFVLHASSPLERSFGGTLRQRAWVKNSVLRTENQEAKYREKNSGSHY